MSIYISDDDLYTVYRGKGERTPARNLSGKLDGVASVRIDDAEDKSSHPSLRIVDATNDKSKIEYALHNAKIPFSKGQERNQVKIANTAQEIAAFRLGVWAEENLDKLNIPPEDRWDNDRTIKLKDGTEIKLDKSIPNIPDVVSPDISVTADSEYRYKAMDIAREGKSVSSDISIKCLENIYGSNERMRAFRDALSDAIQITAQEKYKEYLAEAEKELESGKALIAPVKALKEAGLIKDEQANAIVYNELSQKRVKLSGAYETISFVPSLAATLERGYKQLEASDLTTLDVIVSDLDMRVLFGHSTSDKPLPYVSLEIPEARAKEFESTLQEFSMIYRPAGKDSTVETPTYKSIFSSKTENGLTTITIDYVPHDEVINNLRDEKLLPKAIADAIDREFKDLRAQAQKGVIDTLPPDPCVSDATGIGKAKNEGKSAKKY